MADNAELHGRILGFLMGEWARKDNRQLVGVDLLYAPGGGFRDEEVRRWERADEPEFFAEFTNIEKLVALIIDIAEGEADAKPPGHHRFVVRTRQHMGSKPSMSFALRPSYTGGDDMSMVPSHGGAGPGGGGGGRSNDIAVAQVLSQNNSQLMRTNQQMFDGTIRVLGQQNMNLHDQVAALTSENATLRKELEEARSNKMDREFQIAMAADKNARANAGFTKLLQLGTVVAAKIGTGNEVQAGGAASPLAMLFNEFYQSLRQDQMGALMQTLDMAQKIMLMEIVQLVNPQQGQQGQQGQPPSGQPGAPNGRPPG